MPDLILGFLVQVSILLFAARLCAEIAERLGQPGVLGEILAGVLLGPSGLAGLVPAFRPWIMPETQGPALIEALALPGAMFLLLIIGLELDPALIRRHARRALGASLGGLLLTFALGLLLGQSLPDRMLAGPDQRLVFSLFLATSMSITAIAVLARVLFDLGLTRRSIGQSMMAAAMIDDTVSWLLLGLVVGLADANAPGPATSLFYSALRLGGFLVFAFVVARPVLKIAVRFLQERMVAPHRQTAFVVLIAFVFGAIAHGLHLEAILGAFVAGIVFGRIPYLSSGVRHGLQSMSFGVLTPIFFATIGLKADVRAVLTFEYLPVLAAVIATACAGKICGVFIGARLLGRVPTMEALAMGFGLNSRGAVEIVIASIGLSIGVLTGQMFTIIVIMAIFTSVISPALLRRAMRHVPQTAAEEMRAERERGTSAHRDIHRVLMPLRSRKEMGPHLEVELAILERLRRNSPLVLTLFTAVDESERKAAGAYLRNVSRRLESLEPYSKVVAGSAPETAILSELRNDYDLLVLGAPERGTGTEMLFTPMVDYLVRMAGCPTLVVSGASASPGPQRLKRILVPSNGTIHARRAADLACSIADEDAEILFLHVLGRERNLSLSGTEDLEARGNDIVQDLQGIATARGMVGRGILRSGAPEMTIPAVANEEAVDLILLGTNLRTGSARLLLGPRVAGVLSGASCPVIVYSS